MKTILVTGGMGFIGSHLVQYLHDNYPRYRILVVDALTYAGNIQNCPENLLHSARFEFWHGDVRNEEFIDALVARADIVIHMAAETHVTRSIYNARLFIDANVAGTQVVASTIVKHRSQVERFLYISSSEVYGTALSLTMDENHPLNPMSPYASAKCAADRLVYSYWATYNIPAIIVRPFNTYGPYQHIEKAVPQFITECILGEPLTIHGDGSAARDWMYVQDLCEALDRLIHVDRDKVLGEVINLGTGKHKSILEIARAIQAAMQATDLPLRFSDNRPGQVLRHTCNASKAKRLLDWEARISFEAGLEHTIRWYCTNESRWRPQLWMRRIPVISPEGQRELR